MPATGQATNRTDIELPMDVSREILQKTQEASAIQRLARRVNLPGDGLIIPMITGDPTANWVTETGMKPVSNPSFDRKLMQAHKLAVIVPFSDEFRRDRKALYDQCIRRLPLALAAKFDETVLFGPASTLANFDNFSAVTQQALDTSGKTAYDGLVAADIDISEQGGIVDGYVFSPQGRGILLSAVDANKRPLFINSVADDAIPRVLGAPTYFVRSAYKAGVTKDIVGFAGDWSHAMWGTVEGVKIDISTEATLTYTNEDNETVTINLFQQNMFAVRAEIEVGFAAETEYFNALTRAHA
ncbi:MAG: phage major capsid protein [Blautia sp.]|nr:phage major capsid protein [Blautia sp.]